MAHAGYPQNRIQLGREVTPGTAVASTVIFRGRHGSIEDRATEVIVEEEVGVLVNAERSYVSQELAGMTMAPTELTFEQVAHILEAGIGTVTPSGAGPYVREYAMPTGNTVNTIKTYTVESHNVIAPADAQEMYYGFVQEFTLAAEVGQAWMMSANWIGRRPTSVAFTPALTLPTVTTPALLNKTKLYIDAGGGTLGATQVLGILMGAEVKVTTGLVPVFTGDGNLYFATHKFTRPSIEWKLKMELEETGGNSRVATERAIAASNAVRLFRLRLDGDTAGQRLDIDMAGKYTRQIGGYENSNGNTTVTFSGRAVFSTADSMFAKFNLTNTLAAL